MPSVTEIVIYTSKLIKYGKHHSILEVRCVGCDLIYTSSFPNLKKISIINNGSSEKISLSSLMGCTDPKRYGRIPPLPKLNHIIVKGINFYPGSFEESQVLALRYKIKLDVI